LPASFGEPVEASLLGNVLGDVGDASYALYLCHVPPIQLVRRALVWEGIEPAAALWLFLGVVTVLVAIAIFRLIEAPVTRTLRRHLRMAADPAAARG
jgi:peptidoglycan/LPS O-acetylase OafA/YrhL